MFGWNTALRAKPSVRPGPAQPDPVPALKTPAFSSREHWRYVDALRLREAEHYVHVLYRLSAGPLDEVVHGHQNDSSAGQPVWDHVHEDVIAVSRRRE